MEFVSECIETNWISSIGKFVGKFELNFAEYIGKRYALTCSSGTTALHLALAALGIGPGDEVIVPTLTYVATANAVIYTGAKPVFIDCEKETWNLDVKAISQTITARTKAIVVVHLYGHPCDMDPIIKLARKYGLFVVEDAAEALGSKYKGAMCGGIGDIGVFSFYGNKLITTGEGGIVVTDNKELSDKVKVLKGQGMDPNKRYWFPVLGYNYRMTNIQAAIGLAQLENIHRFVERRRAIGKFYHKALAGIPGIILPVEKKYGLHSYWMYSILINSRFGRTRDEVMSLLEKRGIETRPFFFPLHSLPIYSRENQKKFECAEEISRQGLNLPTFYELREDDIAFISNEIRLACAA